MRKAKKVRQAFEAFVNGMGVSGMVDGKHRNKIKMNIPTFISYSLNPEIGN